MVGIRGAGEGDEDESQLEWPPGRFWPSCFLLVPRAFLAPGLDHLLLHSGHGQTEGVPSGRGVLEQSDAFMHAFHGVGLAVGYPTRRRSVVVGESFCLVFLFLGPEAVVVDEGPQFRENIRGVVLDPGETVQPQNVVGTLLGFDGRDGITRQWVQRHGGAPAGVVEVPAHRGSVADGEDLTASVAHRQFFLFRIEPEVFDRPIGQDPATNGANSHTNLVQGVLGAQLSYSFVVFRGFAGVFDGDGDQ